jgi:hypothetical protein
MKNFTLHSVNNLKKRLFIAFALFLGITFNTHAQDKKIIIGGGFGTGDFFAGNAPFPIHIFAEKPIRENITGGIFLSYGMNKDDYRSGSYYYSYTESAFRIAARGNYNFNELLKINDEKLQIYGGAMVGFRYGRVKYDDNYTGLGSLVTTLGTIGGSGFFSGIHVGGRYSLTEKLGAYLELGRAASWVKIGIVTSL